MARVRNKLAAKVVDKAIAEAKETGQRIELSDGGGLVLRCPPSGIARWTFAYRSRAKGGMRRVTLGLFGSKAPALSLKLAREARDREEARNGQGEDPKAAQERQLVEHRKGVVTFGELCDQYLAYIQAIDPRTGRPSKASWKNDEGYLKRPKAKFGKRSVGSITRGEIREFLEEIAKASPSSANRTQSVIRTMWGYANDKDILTENFLHGMKKVGGKEAEKDRVLTLDELKAFFAILNDEEAGITDGTRLALKAVLLTAQRPGEVAGMMRSELHGLDGDKPHWIIPTVRTKNKKAEHTVPLSPTAVKLIEAALEIGKPEDGEDKGDRPVFASRFESVGVLARHSMSQAVRRLLEDKELAAFTPHDLRRTAATIVQAVRLPVDYVKALLNHNDKGVTGVYARWHMFEEKREAILAIEATLGTYLER
ncbi:tyrosine-type recombinase/integrase [Bradyrhizobium huanghuaihaiense]|uniref:tyrosine-type recombinase/integrase n=1 Tax=Bradyrhizobium huanghuaihaiense TaxID=990078 RepID=UPI0021AAD7B1|nr:site-specific integrase [Bradyrhizobium sp. CB3035]UWU80739.1 tyrosine-type recombinase/integrase [Bradyrhizobium sp. CB3035]